MAITISDYIIGCVGFDITEAALASIFFKRGINAWVDASTLSTQKQELCIADALAWGTTLPSGGKRVEDADAGWKHNETGAQVSDSDKICWRRMANEIYLKYGEKTIGFGFNIKSF